MGRPDGKKLKNLGVEYHVMAHVMKHRYDALNMITLDIPVAPVRHYLNEKRKEGKRYSHLTVMLAAIVRTFALYPQLNRFIVNKRIYARNEMSIGMVVLKNGDINDASTTDKMKFDLGSTIEDVDRVCTEYVEKNRNPEDVNSTDKMAGVLTSVPGLLRVGAGFLMWLDKHNMMPKKVIEISPFHCSLMFTNLASIKTNHIYHHAYDFGTVSLTLAMGNMRDVPSMKGGEVTLERCIPLGLVMDERIASGAYFAIAFREFQRLMANPELLEVPPAEVKTEI